MDGGKWNATLHFHCLPSRRGSNSHFPLSRLIHFSFRFFFVLVAKLLHQLDALSIADMGLIPYELLVPLGQLKQLNLSGNHLVNVSMQIIYPVNGLEVFNL